MRRELTVRHFRQIVVWPLQLMPLRPGQQVQRHWEALDAMKGDNHWREVVDEFSDPADFHERHYKEFVTFLPYVQRFLYGSTAGQESAKAKAQGSMHVFRRDDVARVRIVFQPGEEPTLFEVAHIDLYFFLDADIATLAFEMYTDNIPLDRAQDTLFRFGRAYPAYWERNGHGGNCPYSVEWLSKDGEVLAASDFAARAKYLAFVARYRTPCLAHHWDYLLHPLMLEYPGQTGKLRYRLLEYNRMPFMSFFAVDDPTELTRADFVRIGMVTRPGEPDTMPYSSATLADFERDYCDDRFWGRSGERFSGDTRIIVTGQTFSIIGRHDDYFFSGAATGLLGQFRHQYFLLFLIPHLHKAALLMLSDRMVHALNRLNIHDAESVKRFKRIIRQLLEIFLRFTHRYWFHEVSDQPQAKELYRMTSSYLGADRLYDEIRNEIEDMSNYLESDTLRRQANTVVRLTVVTAFGLIGTVATGFLGMNLIALTDATMLEKIGYFIIVLIPITVLTFYTIVKSKRLSDFLEALSDERLPARAKLGSLLDVWRRAPKASLRR